MEEFDEVFANQVWKEFFPRLARLAKQKLKSCPQREFDEEDVALSAINSFFNGVKAGRFELQERDELWKLLAVITARKVVKQQRRFLADKRGRGQIRGESVFQTSEENAGFEFVLDKNQMPEFEDQVLNACEEMLSSLKNENLRKTAELRMQGFTVDEISTKLECSSARTKQRLAKIKESWAVTND